MTQTGIGLDWFMLRGYGTDLGNVSKKGKLYQPI
jgi:hypothetical protein